MNKLKSVVLLSEDFWNHVDDRWTWQAVLRQRNDGRFTLSLVQQVERPPSQRVPGLVGFRRGAQLYEFLNSRWEELTSEPLDEVKWKRLSRLVRAFNKALGDELVSAIANEDLDLRPPSETPSQVEAHAARASWDPSGFSGPMGGMRGFAEANFKRMRSQAVLRFVQQYVSEHRVYPVGEHLIELDDLKFTVRFN